MKEEIGGESTKKRPSESEPQKKEKEKGMNDIYQKTQRLWGLALM